LFTLLFISHGYLSLLAESLQPDDKQSSTPLTMCYINLLLHFYIYIRKQGFTAAECRWPTDHINTSGWNSYDGVAFV